MYNVHTEICAGGIKGGVHNAVCHSICRIQFREGLTELCPAVLCFATALVKLTYRLAEGYTCAFMC